MAKFTQQAIMLSLLKLLQEKSIDKITVKDICEMCDINRNTFYYYYSDIYQVLEALINNEIEKSLSEENQQHNFYEEYLRKYHLVLEYRKVVYHLYNSKHRDMLLQYFYTITEDFIKKYVLEEASGRDLSETDIQFIVDFYSNSMIGNTLRWLQDGMHNEQEQLIYKMSLSYQATIKALIDQLETEHQK